jgi:hypothetical protein
MDKYLNMPMLSNLHHSIVVEPEASTKGSIGLNLSLIILFEGTAVQVQLPTRLSTAQMQSYT